MIKWFAVLVVALLLITWMVTGNDDEETVQASTRVKTIPGIATVDLLESLQNRGLNCVGPQNVESEQEEWICTEEEEDYTFRVVIGTVSEVEIRSIEASGQNLGNRKTDDVTRDFLADIAAIPYKGALTGVARAWVSKNVREGQYRRTIGGVQFRQEASDNTRTLFIAPAD